MSAPLPRRVRLGAELPADAQAFTPAGLRLAAVAREVLRGRGVAVLPRYFIERDLARGTLVEPLPKARLSSDYFRLVSRSDHVRADELAALAEALRQSPLR